MDINDIVIARLEGRPDPRDAIRIKCEREINNLAHRNAAHKVRVRVFCGDLTTGKAYAEEWGTIGEFYLSQRTKASLPYPCFAGRKADPAAIVAIYCIDSQFWVFRHPDFSTGTWTVAPSNQPGYEMAVYHDGELYANCRSMDEAMRLTAFMQGIRHTKGGRLAKPKPAKV